MRQGVGFKTRYNTELTISHRGTVNRTDAPILSNPVLVRCEGGEPLMVSGGELMVVVEASFEP